MDPEWFIPNLDPAKIFFEFRIQFRIQIQPIFVKHTYLEIILKKP